MTSLFVACNKTEDSVNCKNENYDKEFTVTLGESVCFPDGNSFEVKTIRDQFCCCLCICVWEGELEVMVETTDNTGKKDLFTFGSSLINGNNQIFEGYTVSQFNYLYDVESDSLPLCVGEFDATNVELLIAISAN